MTEQPQLHSSIIAMISLSSGIASKHPDMGLCQIDRLRKTGIPEHQINAVIDISKHIRDEASQKFDTAFNDITQLEETITEEDSTPCTSTEQEPVVEKHCGCTPTADGQSCC